MSVNSTRAACAVCLAIGLWAGWKLRGSAPDPSPAATSMASSAEAKEETKQETITRETIRYVDKEGPVVKETVTETRYVETKTGTQKTETKPVPTPLPRYVAGASHSTRQETSVYVGGRIGNLPVFITGGATYDKPQQKASLTAGVLLTF